MTKTGKCLILLSLLVIYLQVKSQGDQRPLRLISDTECDRYNLDALYHDQYKIITKDILTEMKIFVELMIDRMFLSLQEVLMQLPGRESSDKAEERMFRAFEESKKIFVKKMDKIEENTTKAWESVLDINYKFLSAQKEGTPEIFLEKIAQLEEAYDVGRQVLDKHLQIVVSPMKVLIVNSMNGVEQIIIRKKSEKDSHHHQHHHRANDKEEETVEHEQPEPLNDSNYSSTPVSPGTSDDEDEVEVNNEDEDKHDGEAKEDEEEKSDIEKKKEMIRDIVPGFLGVVSEMIVERNVDLTKHLPEIERDSPFDEIVFAVVITARRVKELLHPENLSSDEALNLARRDLFMAWAHTAMSMYSDKIKKRKEDSVPKEPAVQYFQKKWSKDDALAESLLTLLEKFP